MQTNHQHKTSAKAPKIERAEKQYLDGLRLIYEHGTDLANPRTGKVCRTIINIDMVYDASNNKAPITTTRKPSTKLPIAELLGYIQGTTSAAQMRKLGTKSWDSNANENGAWLANPNRKGEDDLGLIYGAVAKNWPVTNPSTGASQSIDLFRKVYNNLKNGTDDRGEIITFWNPGMFHLGCLRPCMYEHQFSLVGDDLYLNSTQRSSDWALGTDANKLQVWLLLRLMAQITGKNPMIANHRNVNCHIYGDQLPFVPTQLEREMLEEPTLDINPDIKTLDDLETWVTVDDFKITIPKTHESIKYPFSV
jgi:thymidylate synthase